MSDLRAARLSLAKSRLNEVHWPNAHTGKTGQVEIERECSGCGDDWPCDTAVLLLAATPEPTPRAQRLLKAESENRCGDLACETRRVAAAVRVMGGWKEHADYAWAVEAFEVEIGVRDPALLGKEPDDIPSRATIEAEAFARGQAATPQHPERLATQLPDPDAPLRVRRRAAADLAVWTANRLTEIGFGCEIIATWEARTGERTAAHVTTANPAARLHERTEPKEEPR